MKPFALFASAALLAAPALLASPGGDAPDAGFKTSLQKHAAQNNTDEMAKLVKSRLDDAIAWIVWTGEQIADRPSVEHEAFMRDLRAAWKAGMKSEFAEKEYEYFKNIGASRKDRNDLKARFDKATQEFRDNELKKDSWVLLNLVDELDTVGSGLEQEGDLYQASEAYLMLARSYDEEMRGESAERHKAWDAYRRGIEAREKVDLKDPAYDDAVKRRAALASKGFDKKEAGPAAGPAAPAEAPPAPVADLGAPVTVALAFEPVPSVETYLRPNYVCDEVTELWFVIPIKAKGSGATLARIDGAPQILRVGASELRIDANGDGTGDDKVPLMGNIALVKMTVGKGAAARPWAFLAQCGSNRDQYQGMAVNFEPSDKEFPVYACAAASVVGSIGGTSVRVIDDSLDGIYGSAPQTWRNEGLTADVFQPEMDSIVIGSSKRARPWSEFVDVDGKWHKLESITASSKELRATPVQVETGTLKLEFKGPPPTWVVVHGDGEYKSSYFDLVEGGAKGVAVPAGKYKLYYGEMRAGKKKLVRKTLILPGKSTPTWDVKTGQTTVVTLGAPFGFDFKHTFESEKLSVTGRSVAIVGSQGERYERTWNCVPRPEVSWRKKGTKKSNKGDKMPALLDTEGLSKYGRDAAWSPLDLVLVLKGEKGPIEVQLTEKKHDLFGKIESDWRE